MMIGVSVQEAIEDTALQHGEPVSVERRGSVQALGVPSLRSKASKSSLVGSKTPNAGWLTKARDFTLKFKRKPLEKQTVV